MVLQYFSYLSVRRNDRKQSRLVRLILRELVAKDLIEWIAICQDQRILVSYCCTRAHIPFPSRMFPFESIERTQHSFQHGHYASPTTLITIHQSNAHRQFRTPYRSQILDVSVTHLVVSARKNRICYTMFRRFAGTQYDC